MSNDWNTKCIKCDGSVHYMSANDLCGRCFDERYRQNDNRYKEEAIASVAKERGISFGAAKYLVEKK